MNQTRRPALSMPRYSILYTGGTFDLFHAGHATFLRQCSEIADSVIVSLNTDEFVREFKDRAPVMSFEERRVVLAACAYVHGVVKNIGGQDSKPAIEVVSPQVIAIGSDWEHRDYYSQMGFSQEWLDERGIDLQYLAYTEGVSTTDVKTRVHKRKGI